VLQVLLELNRAWDSVQSAAAAAAAAPSWPEAHVTLGRAQLNLGEARCSEGLLQLFLQCRQGRLLKLARQCDWGLKRKTSLLSQPH